MRLLMLLSFLAGGLWLVAQSADRGEDIVRRGLLPEIAQAQEQTKPSETVLPATVARLVRNQDAGAATLVVARMDQRGPVVLPMPASVTRAPTVQPTAENALARLDAIAIAQVTANSANVRGGPSTSNPVVGRLTKGEEVAILETLNGWAHIRVEGDGVEGWISTKLLTN